MNVLAATRAYVDRIVSDPNNPGMKVLLLADKGNTGRTGLLRALVSTLVSIQTTGVTPTRRARDHNPKAARSTLLGADAAP